MTEEQIISLIDKAKSYRSETHNLEFKDAISVGLIVAKGSSTNTSYEPQY